MLLRALNQTAQIKKKKWNELTIQVLKMGGYIIMDDDALHRELYF